MLLYTLGKHFYKINQIFEDENDENLKYFKMSSELLYKFRSSIKIMFRRIVDIKTFNLEKNN